VALPWSEVNAADSQAVAKLIGLPRRERGERRKWGCPYCGSSDSLHAYPGVRGGFGCWGACGADQPKGCRGYSNIDIARGHWGTSLPDTCRRLADALGILYDDGPWLSPSRRQRPSPPPLPRERVTEQERNLAGVAAAGGRLPPVIYADLLSRLRLTARGRDYLTAVRRLDARAAAKYGYRSVDGKRAWTEVGVYLAATYREDELRAAGFPLDEDRGGLVLPFRGRIPALVIPYRYCGEVVGLRFRNLLPDRPEFKSIRYRSLTAARPPHPYNADAAHDGGVVFVIEGDLNAETVRQYGESVLGNPGAGMWLRRWTPSLAAADRIVPWFDFPDRLGAGDRGVQSFRRSLVEEFGAAWVAERWARLLTAADANELHRRGALAEVLAMATGPVDWLRPVRASGAVPRPHFPFAPLLLPTALAPS
jgi:hypothetical protein